MPFRTLTSTLASVIAMLPGTVLAVTLASGSDSTHYVISLEGLASTSCELIGAENIGVGGATGAVLQAARVKSAIRLCLVMTCRSYLPASSASMTSSGSRVRHRASSIDVRAPLPRCSRNMPVTFP